MTAAEALRALDEARVAEKEQALYYRALAALAEDAGESTLAERFHALHADEQHHLSRLTARLVELGQSPDEVRVNPPRPDSLDGWEADARARELDEVARYQALLGTAGIDAATERLVGEILTVEQLHAERLGGKWTMA